MQGRAGWWLLTTVSILWWFDSSWLVCTLGSMVLLGLGSNQGESTQIMVEASTPNGVRSAWHPAQLAPLAYHTGRLSPGFGGLY